MSRVPIAAAALALLALAATFGDGVARAAVVVPALLVLPGAALVVPLTRRVRAGPGAPLALAASLALAPLVAGIAATSCLAAGLPLLLGTRVLLAACAGAFLLTARGVRAPSGAPQATGPAAPRLGAAAPLLAILLAATCAAPLVSSQRVRVSEHGLLHTALLESAVARGVPPENPYFAGEPVRYYWLWHVGAALLREAAVIDAPAAFAGGNVAALLAFLLLLGTLGAGLSGTRRGAALAVLLGFLGLNPLGAFLLFDKAPPPVLPAVAAALAPLEQGASPLDFLHHLAVDGEARVTATLTKFLNVSSFPQAFAAALLALVLLARRLCGAAHGSCRGLAPLAALATAAAIGLSPITGLAVGLAAGTVVLLLAAVAIRRRDRDAARAAGIAAAALVAGLLLALPFVLGGGAGSGEGALLRFEPSPAKLRRVALTLGPILLLALPVLARLHRAPADRRLVAGTALLLAAMGALLWFPVRSEYKMIRLAAPLLGVLAAGALDDLLTRVRPRFAARAAAVTAVACFVPTNGLALAAYVASARAKLPVHAEGTALVLDAGVHPDARLYAWLRQETPRDAVLVEDPRLRARSFAAGTHGSEVPALTGRPVFAHPAFYMNEFEPALGARLALTARLYRDHDLAPEDLAVLAALRRPVFVVVRRASIESDATLPVDLTASPRFRAAFVNDAAHVFEVRFPAGGG